jgi:hypothetical protein
VEKVETGDIELPVGIPLYEMPGVSDEVLDLGVLLYEHPTFRAVHRSSNQQESFSTHRGLTAWMPAIAFDFGVITLITCPLLDSILILRGQTTVISAHRRRADTHVGG